MKDNNIEELLDNQIQQALQGYSETPSNACWDKLSAQLDHLTPQGPSMSSSTGHAWSSWAVKAGITAAAVAGITTAVLLLKPDHITNVSPAPDTALTTTTIQDTLPETTMPSATVTNNTAPAEEIPITHNTSCNEPATPVTAIPVAETTPEPATAPAALPAKETATAPTATRTPATTASTPVKPTAPAATGQEYEEEEPVANTLPEIFIPNIITPNGDGYNDCFEISGNDNTGLNHLIVFTSGGKVIFSKENYHNEWCPDNIANGVYYYYFKYTFQGEQYMRKGSVTIKR